MCGIVGYRQKTETATNNLGTTVMSMLQSLALEASRISNLPLVGTNIVSGRGPGW
ncbi:MAG: hypothetical protein QGF00_21475 [Planctomycetota bacterium]|jgi:hypothetical protein|nr:hypothetical protein [Planctomycetota bacterium]